MLLGEGRPAGDWQAEPPVRPLVHFPTAVNYSAIFKWFVLSLFPQVHLRCPPCVQLRVCSVIFCQRLLSLFIYQTVFLAALAAFYLHMTHSQMLGKVDYGLPAKI